MRRDDGRIRDFASQFVPDEVFGTDSDRTRCLIGTPQLSDFLEAVLEDSLAALGYSCEDYEIGRL
jgi:hypothetical protein